MKRLFAAGVALAAALNLTACGSLRANYREMEELLVLQTLGVDNAEGGGTVLSLASCAASGKSAAPVRMCLTGATVASAVERAQNYSFEETLFISHADAVVLGEAYAAAGAADCVDYITQSPRLRIDMPIYIVRGATAEEAVLNVGDGEAGISEILSGVREYYNTRARDGVFTVADLTRDTLRHGSALVCALELTPSDRHTPDASAADSGGGSPDSGSSGGASSASQGDAEDAGAVAAAGGDSSAPRLTAVAAGYAVMREMRLCGYISPEDSLGVGFLRGRVGQSDVTVTDRRGELVTLEINDGECDIAPRFASDGSLSRVDIAARVNATVLQADGSADFADVAYIDYLTAQLESVVSERIGRVLRLARGLKADFVGLGAAVERAAPAAYSPGAPFYELLPTLELRVSVNGRIIHSNGTRRTVQSEELNA